jgi:hypothetical protein
VALAVSPFVVGCYSMQSVNRLDPHPGSEVAIDLNDAGRAALSSTIGPDVAQLHGNLLRRDSDEDLIAITSSEFLNGGARTWAGETLHVRSEYASRYYASRVSTQRSLIAGGLIVGALAAMAVEAYQGTPTPSQPGGDIPQPGDKLRARPRGTFRFSTNASAAAKIARGLVPFFVRP